jgi:hypothetical protein
VRPLLHLLVMLFALPLLLAQTERFSYSTTLSLEVTAEPALERELKSELSRQFQSIDGLQIVTQLPDRSVEVVAVKTETSVVAAAVAVACPLQRLLDGKLLRTSEVWQGTNLGKTRLLENLIVFTGPADLRDLARRIVSWIDSDHIIPNRDLMYRIFREQHPRPR